MEWGRGKRTMKPGRRRENEKMKISEKKQERPEEKVKQKFRKWLKKQHRDWVIIPNSVQVSLSPYRQYMLSPDIDTLAYYRDSNGFDKLIGFEVKSPIERVKKEYRLYDENREVVGSNLYKYAYISERQKEDEGEVGVTKKQTAGLEYNLIYQGIGQALFHLRWADQSFLVLPRLFFFYGVDCFQEAFPYILYENLLPLGLIEYDWRFESKDEVKIGGFKQTYEAKGSCLWQEPSTGKFNQKSNKILYHNEIRCLRKKLIERCLDKER